MLCEETFSNCLFYWNKLKSCFSFIMFQEYIFLKWDYYAVDLSFWSPFFTPVWESHTHTLAMSVACLLALAVDMWFSLTNEMLVEWARRAGLALVLLSLVVLGEWETLGAELLQLIRRSAAWRIPIHLTCRPGTVAIHTSCMPLSFGVSLFCSDTWLIHDVIGNNDFITLVLCWFALYHTISMVYVYLHIYSLVSPWFDHKIYFEMAKE